MHTVTIPQPGDVLPNMAVVASYTHIADAEGGMLPYGVVLAERVDDYDPFVVWNLAHTEQNTWHTFGGSYCRTLEEAVAVYENRGGLQ